MTDAFDVFLVLLGAALFLLVAGIVGFGVCRLALKIFRLGHDTGVIAEKERRQRLEAEAERRIANIFRKTTESEEWQTEIEA